MNLGNQKFGTWTRVSRPHATINEESHTENEGPKRNTSQAGMDEEIRVLEKRIKLDEEVRHLGVLLKSEFKLVEVVEQPRRVQ